MKSGIFLGLLWIGLLAVSAHGTVNRLPRTSLFGREYVRLEDWARAVGGQARWTAPQQSVRVTVPSGTLTFSIDSRMAMVKGTEVALSVPVALRNGSAYIGLTDVNLTLGPILAPPKNSAGKKVRTIVLDPGHGGKDPGNLEGRRQEKHFTLLFANELSELLGKAGFTVSFTRTRDTTVELPERPAIARKRGADLLLSLHFNSADFAGGSAVKGAETYCMTLARTSSTNARGEGAGSGAYPGNRFDAKNMLLAYLIQRSITEKTGAEDRGVKRARFWVLRDASMPAALIEGGFMTNPSDARRIYEPAQRRLLAQAIVDGVVAYKRAVETP